MQLRGKNARALNKTATWHLTMNKVRQIFWIHTYTLSEWVKRSEVFMAINQTIEADIAILGRCTACFKAKRSTKYCRLKKQHKGEKAAPCQSCFELGLSVSDCKLTHGHCGPGVTWQTAVLEKDSKVNQDIPNCCYELSSAFITKPPFQLILPYF